MQDRFYHILILALFIGFHIYLYISFDASGAQSFCPIKTQLGIPCPACGGTTAISYLWSGEITSSLKTNPLAVITYLASWPLMGLILFDFIGGKQVALELIQKIDRRLSIPKLTYFLLALILLNWLFVLLK
jgi:hypothetical protein